MTAQALQSSADLLRRFRAGDVRALARALSWIEDGDERGREVLRALYPETGRARIIGVTGPPGVGKSTLVNALATELGTAGRKVGILAVDPSSSFSGGAILGDRIRMQESSEASSVFIRSMATRGHLGGLARAAGDAVDVLDAFGFEDILVETVGVGQDEIEVIEVASFNLLVLMPHLGDDVQAIKAGIMEIADAYVVNKADRPGASRMEAHLRGMLQLYEGEPRDVPILRTVASQGKGVSELISLIDERWTVASRTRSSHAERIEARLRLLLRDRLLEEQMAGEDAETRLREAVALVAERKMDPYTAVGGLMTPRPSSQPVLDHLGVAVSNKDEALAFWHEVLGLRLDAEEEVATEGVAVTMLSAGESHVELLTPLVPGEGAVGTFLAKRGPGLHHVCLAVPDLLATLERLKASGASIVGEAPRKGAGGKSVAFVHPKSAGGLLLELSQDGPPREVGQ